MKHVFTQLMRSLSSEGPVLIGVSSDTPYGVSDTPTDGAPFSLEWPLPRRIHLGEPPVSVLPATVVRHDYGRNSSWSSATDATA